MKNTKKNETINLALTNAELEAVSAGFAGWIPIFATDNHYTDTCYDETNICNCEDTGDCTGGGKLS